jgi:alkanesulfonate monooxygenase SsuD/methylene tetrahydromethanopterin reductase-like flavin-dependent oxidoreductase (luciferase family)
MIMRVGVVCLPTDPWPQWRARARHLEDLGYDHLWTYDHLSWRRYADGPWHASLPLLTATAAVTSRIRLGTMVSSPNFRHPVTLAKDAMTLDEVSGGRLTLGVGAGGTGFDAQVLGQAPWSRGERTARFGEFLHLLDRLLRDPATTWSGRYYAAHDARMIPGSVQRPRVPLAVAAAGPRTVAFAARYGDAWITDGDPAEDEPTPEGTARFLREQGDRLDEECVRVGRDPSSVHRIFLAHQSPLSSVEAFTEFAHTYAELGVTDLVFHHPRSDDPRWNDAPAIVDTIASEVLPALRSATT